MTTTIRPQPVVHHWYQWLRVHAPDFLTRHGAIMRTTDEALKRKLRSERARLWERFRREARA